MTDDMADLLEATAPARSAFDAAGILPSGLVALEASAGTGKTYALSSLAVRFVAEAGITASQLCIVSFTDAATAELRGRVRARLVEAADQLESGMPALDDPVLAAIGDVGGDSDLLATRARRLREAVADFDAATISTIHGFCSRVMAAAGSGTEAGTISSGSDDVAEVVNDLLVARHSAHPPVTIPFEKLVAGVCARLSMPDAALFTGDPPARKPSEKQRAARAADDAAIAAAAELIDGAAAEVTRRRALARRRTFDGLLTDSRDLLRGADGPMIVEMLRDRYRVVLIDEFQDTDRVQWEIFRTAFVDPPSPTTMVLVGDPKQSIYRFRSAELSAYLEAVTAAGEQVATLAINWRSDGPLLAGLERVLTGFTFGHPTVGFHPVSAAPHNTGARLDGDHRAPLEFRCVQPDFEGTLSAEPARRAVRTDVVRVVADLLGGRATLPDGSGPMGARRPLRAGDIAILTRSNIDASTLAAALAAAGIPAATAASNSVLESDAARQWEILLRALERPGSSGLVRAAALGWFIGLDPSRLADLDDASVAALHDHLRAWSAELTRRGIPRVLALARAEGLHRRLLGRSGGERNLTDIDHVAELLHGLCGGRPAAASALLTLLGDVESDADGEMVAPDALARRIDRDDDAVQVLTIHKAKGLEFPVVLCPYLWTGGRNSGAPPHAYDGGGRSLDATWVAGISKKVAVNRFRDLDRAESVGESRRLLYVALTRARHRCIVWWAPLSTNASAGPLRELLEHAVGTIPRDLEAFDPLVEAGNGTIAALAVPVDAPPSQPAGAVSGPVPPVADELSVATFTRAFDRSWRIWSFSSITSSARDRVEQIAAGSDPASAHDTDAVIQAETIRGGGADEPTAGPNSDPDPDPDSGPQSSPVAAPPVRLLADAPAGTTFGTLVHEVLERCDFSHPDLVTHLEQLCTDALRFRPQPITPGALAAGLAASIEAPLGGPLSGVRLRDLDRADRVDEMEFLVPLGRLRAHEIGRCLVEHLDPDDVLLPWARRLAGTRPIEIGKALGTLLGDPSVTGFDIDLSGQLTGSIDLVARTRQPGTGATHRYWVADYKSNQFGTRSSYGHDDLLHAMTHHEYALQATLYIVALHRYLRWRLPGYRIHEHLGGAAYLFLRGMDPSRAPDAATGVFWWQPSPSAVEALDRLLAEGARP